MFLHTRQHSRQGTDRMLPQGLLPGKRSFLHTTCLLIILLPVVLASGCEDTALTDDGGTVEPETPLPVQDTVLLQISADCSPDSVRTADCFIYSGSGTKRLEKHFRTEGQVKETAVPVTAGSKTVVMVLNCPYTFNLAALDRLESFELLEFAFSDDDPDFPLMAARCDAEAGSTTRLKPTKLLCSVGIAAVSNNLGGDTLLEEPRVRLTGISRSAKVMQEKDFRPVEIDEYGEWVPLPYDVGFYTQRPGTALFCYPNDTPEDVLGSQKTGLQLECRINGEKKLFDFGLPPLPRGCRIDVELTIESADYARAIVPSRDLVKLDPKHL